MSGVPGAAQEGKTSPTPLLASCLTAGFPCTIAGACNATFILFHRAKGKVICPLIPTSKIKHAEEYGRGGAETLQTLTWAGFVCLRRPDFLLNSVLHKGTIWIDRDNTGQTLTLKPVPIWVRLVAREEGRSLFLKGTVTNLQDSNAGYANELHALNLNCTCARDTQDVLKM